MGQKAPFVASRPSLFKGAFFCFLLLVRVLPWAAFRALTRGVVWVLYFISSRLRRNAQESLDIAFGAALPGKEKSRVARQSFFNLAEGIAGFIYAVEHPEVTEKKFVWEGKEHLDQALARGKGAVVVISHFGPFVWMLQHFANTGYRLNVVMRPPRSAFLKVKFLESQKRVNMAPIYSTPVKSCVLASFETLKRGEIVVFPIDQNYGGQGRVFVDFFGRKAATAPGAVGFSLKTKAPLFMAYCLPMPDGRFKIIIPPEIPLEGEVDDRAALIRYTALITSRFEGLIREHPEQWTWMHRRWKAVPREGEI